MRGVPLCLLALALLATPAVAAEGGEFTITFKPGQAPKFAGAGILAEPVQTGPGAFEWKITTARTHLVGTVVSEGAFPLARPQQLMPEIKPVDFDPDGGFHFFGEVRNPREGAETHRLVNYTMAGNVTTIVLGFPVNQTLGPHHLRFTVDQTPPNYTIGTPGSITDHAFYIETRTDEYAYADLLIRPAGSSAEEIRNPTSIPSLLQRFPIQGLRADTLYEFRVRFWDPSGNEVTSPYASVKTIPTPPKPKANITDHVPARNASLAQAVDRIVVNFTGPQPESLENVRVFVDKKPVLEGITLDLGKVTIRPSPPLGPGKHSVGIELTSPQGGVAETHWSFEVQGAAAAKGAPLPAAAALAGLGLAALVARARRRA